MDDQLKSPFSVWYAPEINQVFILNYDDFFLKSYFKKDEPWTLLMVKTKDEQRLVKASYIGEL